MAEHKHLWYQGSKAVNLLPCTGKPDFGCPESKRIAAEYYRGTFNLTRALQPNIEYDNLGAESWLYRELQSAKVGDYLWLLLVPPMHHVNKVFAYNECTFIEESSYASMGGITLSLVTGEFKAANENGECELDNESSRATLAMAEGADAKQVFVHEKVDFTTDTETWFGVGFKVDVLPREGALADIRGKIAIGALGHDFDAQTFM